MCRLEFKLCPRYGWITGPDTRYLAKKMILFPYVSHREKLENVVFMPADTESFHTCSCSTQLTQLPHALKLHKYIIDLIINFSLHKSQHFTLCSVCVVKLSSVMLKFDWQLLSVVLNPQLPVKVTEAAIRHSICSISCVFSIFKMLSLFKSFK